MNRKGYMKPSMMADKTQAANQILTVSKDVGLHDEVSSNRSYVRESSCGDDDFNSIWDDEW